MESERHRQEGDEGDCLPDTSNQGVDLDYDDDSDADNDGFDPCDESDDRTVDDDDTSLDKGADTSMDLDSGYTSDETDISMKENDRKPAQQTCDAPQLDDFREATRL